MSKKENEQHEYASRRVTKESLADWNNDEKDIGDELHIYFANTYAKWYWIDICREGLSVWEVMFNEKVEDFSPISDIFDAVAAQSAKGAFSAVAAAIGIKLEELEFAVADLYENQDDLPPPVGYDGLKEKVKDARKRIQEIDNGIY